MPNFFRLPKSKLVLIEEYNESLALLLRLTSVAEHNSEEETEYDASYFRTSSPADFSIAALEAGIMLMNELNALKNATLKYTLTQENQEIFRHTLNFAQHLFNKAKDDINTYQLTPAHAQLLAFDHTLKATTKLVNEPNLKNGKSLDKSVKALQAAIKKDPCPATNRLFYAFTGAVATFIGVLICASTLALLLASPITLAGFGSVASIVLGGISGTLISTGIHLLRKAFAPNPQQTPQELELVNSGNNTAEVLAKLSKNPGTLFARRQESSINDSPGHPLAATLDMTP